MFLNSRQKFAQDPRLYPDLVPLGRGNAGARPSGSGPRAVIVRTLKLWCVESKNDLRQYCVEHRINRLLPRGTEGTARSTRAYRDLLGRGRRFTADVSRALRESLIRLTASLKNFLFCEASLPHAHNNPIVPSPRLPYSLGQGSRSPPPRYVRQCRAQHTAQCH